MARKKRNKTQHKFYTPTCEQCHKPFEAKRSHAKFCSNACRAKFSQLQKPQKQDVQNTQSALFQVLEKQSEDIKYLADAVHFLFQNYQEGKLKLLPDEMVGEIRGLRADIKQVFTQPMAIQMQAVTVPLGYQQPRPLSPPPAIEDDPAITITKAKVDSAATLNNFISSIEAMCQPVYADAPKPKPGNAKPLAGASVQFSAPDEDDFEDGLFQ